MASRSPTTTSAEAHPIFADTSVQTEPRFRPLRRIPRGKLGPSMPAGTQEVVTKGDLTSGSLPPASSRLPRRRRHLRLEAPGFALPRAWTNLDGYLAELEFASPSSRCRIIVQAQGGGGTAENVLQFRRRWHDLASPPASRMGGPFPPLADCFVAPSFAICQTDEHELKLRCGDARATTPRWGRPTSRRSTSWATKLGGRLSFGQKVFARKGTVLIEEGCENGALFVVGHGALSISVHGEEIATVGPGQVIGLYTMLKGTLASASVVVSSDVAYILELRHSHFMACLDDNPDVKNRMQILLEQREAQNKAAEMISKTTLREVCLNEAHLKVNLAVAASFLRSEKGTPTGSSIQKTFSYFSCQKYRGRHKQMELPVQMGGCSQSSSPVFFLGWAALHLPAIEELLRCMPEEGPCDSGDVFGTFKPGVDTGVQHPTVFRTALNTLPLETSSGGFGLPTPPWPSFKVLPQDHKMLDVRGQPPIRSEQIAAHASAPWQVPQVDMLQDAPGLLPAYMMQDVSAHPGGSEEINNRPVGHKKVPKKINIQEEFAHSDCEITTAMIRNVPNQLNRKQFLERLDQLGFRGLYDFVYVPMDRSTRMNVGYAFVNFIKPEFFRMCQAVLQGKSFLEKEDRNKRKSGKPIVVSPAHVQGLQNNEKHFKDAAVSHTLHRPVKFVCNGHSGP
ncbi:ML2 [Symbiodinium sp. CCMP2456]|nr:ML2 [Symbiodinium sp. CCMP2456]